MCAFFAGEGRSVVMGRGDMASSRLCIASASLRWKKERGKSLFGLKRLLCCCFLIERKCTLLLFTEDEDVDGCICEEIKAPWGMAGVDVAADMMEGGTESMQWHTGTRMVT